MSFFFVVLSYSHNTLILGTSALHLYVIQYAPMFNNKCEFSNIVIFRICVP